MSRLRIKHKGRVREDDLYEIRLSLSDPDLREAIAEGDLSIDGQALDPAAARRLRDRLLGTYDHLPPVLGTPYRLSPDGQPRRFLVEGVWPEGTIPMLAGNPKAGKTALVLDLAASLLQPGRRFLDRFEVPPLDPEGDLGRGVWVINAETAVQDFEGEMRAQGISQEHYLTVDHLEEFGGAQAFDLRDPANFDLWADRFVQCSDCNGLDDWSPFVVIVDGLTAVLQDSARGPLTYGEWFMAFKRLMRSLDIPNALVTGHSPMNGGNLLGGVESMAGPEGLWLYEMGNQHNPASKRWFSVMPRLGGAVVKPTEVTLSDGRLRAAGERPSKPSESEAVDEVQVVAERTAVHVREHPGVDGQALTDGIEASSKEVNLEGRRRAVSLGLVREELCSPACSLCSRPHHRRRHYWPPRE